MKKFLFTILILAVLAAIGAGMYLYFTPKVGVGPAGRGSFQEFSPLEIGEGGQPGEEIITGGEEVTPEEILIPGEEIAVKMAQISKITDRPIAGNNLVYDEAGSLFIYYIDRSSGNIYRRILNKEGVLGGEERITTTIIPGIHEAFFVSKNSKVVLRYTKEDSSLPPGYSIQTFLGNLPKEKPDGSPETGELKGLFLEENISNLSVSPDTNKLFYLTDAENTALGYTYDLATNKKSSVFSSAFTEWLSQYITAGSVVLTAKASASAPGASYLLNLSSKNYPGVIGGTNGLTTLGDPSGKNILYSNNAGALSLLDLDKKASSSVGLNTLSEKCVWSKDGIKIYCAVPENLSGQIPDDWYLGRTSFTDGLWGANIGTGNTKKILEAADLPAPADMTSLKLDEQEKYLSFINKKDNSLWLIDLRI